MPCIDGWSHPHIVTVTHELTGELRDLFGTVIVPTLAVFAATHDDAERIANVVLAMRDNDEEGQDG